MKIVELEPIFIQLLQAETESASFMMAMVEEMKEADGIRFLCPKCFMTNGGRSGTHSVICWRPKVPLNVNPTPGRWEFEGKGFFDLTLVAGSSSIQVGSGCMAHFFIERGEIRMS